MRSETKLIKRSLRGVGGSLHVATFRDGYESYISLLLGLVSFVHVPTVQHTSDRQFVHSEYFPPYDLPF